ncbi:MAG: FGGY-family carbohydrate kinase [Bacteroidota bacterium]
MALFAGLDLGTTGCKAGFFTAAGEPRGMAYREYPVRCPAPGLAEQDANLVWETLLTVLGEAVAALRAAGRDPAEVRAASLSVQGDAVIPVDRRGDPLGPALLGMDRRNLAEAAELAERIGRERLFGLTGMPAHPVSALTKMMWLARHHPRAGEIAGFWHYEEFILNRLCGRALTDYSMASRSLAFALRDREYSSAVLAAAGIDRELLAEAAPSGTIAGEIRPALAAELGLPRGMLLVTGGHDQVCAAVGAGVVREGLAVDSTGTAEVVAAALDRPLLGPEMLAGEYPCYLHAVPGMYFTISLNQGGGISLRWLRDNLARAEAAEAAAAGQDAYDYLTRDLPGGPGRVIFLPHLVGGGTPHGDQRTKGAFLGLTLAASVKDLVLAVLEGLTYELRVNLEALARAGLRVAHLRVVGGGARSDRWLQLKADITGCTVETLRVREAALLGAALIAATVCGEYPSLMDAAGRAVSVDRTFAPDPALREAYDRHYEIYRRVYPALREIHHALG